MRKILLQTPKMLSLIGVVAIFSSMPESVLSGGNPNENNDAEAARSLIVRTATPRNNDADNTHTVRVTTPRAANPDAEFAKVLVNDVVDAFHVVLDFVAENKEIRQRPAITQQEQEALRRDDQTLRNCHTMGEFVRTGANWFFAHF